MRFGEKAAFCPQNTRPMKTNDPYLVPGLVRGLEVLQAFTPRTPEMSLTNIAEAMGITRSAAFRTVHTLVSEGYLLATGDGTRYRLGPSVLRLTYGYHASRELLEVAQPPLEKLRDDCDWSTHLGVLDGKHILYLMRLPATGGLSSLVHVGSRLPAASTSMGRVFLADRSEKFVRKVYSDLDPKSREKILQTRLADKQSATIQSVGQFESGLCSVAAPVSDMSGQVVAAISATKVASSIPPGIVDQVLKAAEAISRGLGWREDHRNRPAT